MKNSLKFTVAVGLLIAVSISSTVVNGQQKNSDEALLTSKQEAIVPIAAYAAKGDQINLKIALAKGLETGLTVNEIKEILVQLYAYAGFPRSLNAISTFYNLVNERQQKGIADAEGKKPAKIDFGGQKYQFGKDVQAKLTGRPANSTQTFVPVIDTLLKEHLFADIFGRDNLDYQSREIATISILSSIGGAESQLRSHLNVGRNVGLSEKQLRYITGKLLIYEPTFSKGNKVQGGNFTGDVWVNMLASVDSAINTSVGNVTFAPKARSNWHLHPSGQTLLITDGVGYYQEKGQPVRVIRKGDVIKCTANVAHWHGASSDSSMSHIALGPNNGKGAVKWMEKVTDDEYNKMDSSGS